MRKFFTLIITFVLLSAFLFGGVAMAVEEESSGLTFDPQEADADLGSAGEVNLGQEAPLTIASQIMLGVFGFLGIIFLILTIYGGVLWMTARGNEEQVTKAKNILKTAVIGLIIILTSYGVAQFIYLWVSSATYVG